MKSSLSDGSSYEAVPIEQCVVYEHPHVPQHSPSDWISLWLHHILPRRLQWYIRDIGGVKWINNTMAYFIGLALAVSNPRVLIDYTVISRRVRTIAFDPDNGNHFLEVINIEDKNAKPVNESKNILIFVYGGAWGSGHAWMYRLCAVNAAKCLQASHVILIEYSIYPTARIDDQVNTVH